MKMRVILFTIVLIFLKTNLVFSQDTQYSQFYAAPLYLNPGFTGSITQHRFVANYRNQWPGLPNAFNSFSASYDYHEPHLNSGFGLIANTDRAGSANLSNSSLNLIYSYFISMENKVIIKPAISVGYAIRSLDFDRLVFGDQLDFGVDGAPSADPQVGQIGSRGNFEK